jgi:hypothetical protein
MVNRPIELAPDWVRQLITPMAELTAAREQALRFLAGDTTIQARVLEDVEDVFDDEGFA